MDEDYKTAMQMAMENDRANIELKRMQDMLVQQHNHMGSAIANNHGLWGGVFNNGVGVVGGPGQVSNIAGLGLPIGGQAMQQMQQVKPVQEREEILLFKGEELSTDWRGASYDSFQRSIRQVSRQWRVDFHSKWASDTIMIWFSMDKYSGAQVDDLAKTYLEVINTRRLG